MENPIPCVGFELQYSPLERRCVENLAQALHANSGEFTFDVFRAVPAGQEIRLLFSNTHSPTQHLLAEVRTCRKLAKNHYQITLTTDTTNGVVIDNTDVICLPISKGTAVPTQMTSRCPACNTNAVFHFIANQDGDWEQGILPMYNCGSCGTTRVMIGLINTNISENQ